MNLAHTSLWFGQASHAAELEQILRLNHRTFAEEIPQHARRRDARLVDRFHMENTYVICKQRERVIGMLALRGRRPFSLDQKLPDLDRYLPRGRSVCEIRLLSVEKGFRHGRVLPGLVCELVRVCRDQGYEYAVISATTRQVKLYAHLGFEPFGPQVGKPGAYFQPMRVGMEEFSAKVPWLATPTDAVRVVADPESNAICLLPGPADIHPEVLAAMGAPPQPHRSAAVANLLERCRAALTRLTRSEDVQVMLGSGTLANDAIAQQLRLANKSGVVLSNGEFGERLVDHAVRAGLKFIVCRADWGKSFDFRAIRQRVLQTGVSPGWIWMTHCETSTGVLNDTCALNALAREIGAECILDCISSIGNVDVDVRFASYASGVSGKGLAAPPGIAFVFHRSGRLLSSRTVPRYLDLDLYADSAGMPFTQSSNLLAALAVALQRVDPAQIARRAAISVVVRAALRRRGFRLVGDDAAHAPFVVTIALPPDARSAAVGAAMLTRGYRVAFESTYLKDRNWLQLAWMGGIDSSVALRAVAALADICGQADWNDSKAA